MPYDPPVITDNVTVGDAAFWLAQFEDIHDQAVANAAPLPPGGGGARIVTAEGIDPTNTAAVNSTAMATLIADINAGGQADVYFPPGLYQFNGMFPPIRRDGTLFYGAGRLLTRLAQASSSTNGVFFQVGSRTDAAGAFTNDRTVGFDCRDMGFQCFNTPPADQNVFSLVQTDQVAIERIFITGVAGLITVGSSNDDGLGIGTGDAIGCPRTTVRDVGGSIADVDGNVIWLRQCGGNSTFENIMLRGEGGGLGSGRWVYIQPCNRKSFSAVEGVQFDKCDLWAGDDNGLPNVNCQIDVTNGGARNINFSKCLWDTSVGSTVKIHGAPTAAKPGDVANFGCVRLIRFEQNYFNSNISSGMSLFIEYDHLAPNYCEAIYVVNCKMSLMDLEAVRVRGDGRVSEVVIDGCTVLDLKPTRATALSAAFIFEKGDWTVVNNTFRGGVTPVDDQNVNYAVRQFTPADNYIAANNRSAGLNTDFFSGAVDSATRIIANNTYVP